MGIVSAIGGAWRSSDGGVIDQFVRLDLNLDSSMEGGALVSATGQVVGMTVSRPRRSVISIPSATINRVVEQLLAKGHIARGYLGLGMQPVHLPETLKNTLNLASLGGVIVINGNHATLEVVGAASEMTTLAARVEEVQPDVVLLWLGNEAILEELAFITKPNAPAVVVLADNVEQDWATEVLNNPVQAILPRSATADEIIASIIAAALGLVVLHPDFSEELFSRNQSIRPVPPTPIQALTGREIEVLGMLALGLGNKTIAKQLGISEHTVKFHLSSIFGKLNAASRTEAVTVGARLGLILL